MKKKLSGYTSKILVGYGFALLICVASFPGHAMAQTVNKLGVHLLETNELAAAKQLVVTDQSTDEWHYVTIPFTLDDVNQEQEWRQFFISAQEYRLIPIVRLATRFENEAWQVPTRKEVTTLIDALAKLDWPTDQKHIIVFNEVNHAPEWGGRLDPAEYARTLRFAADWAHSENAGFVVLPAAMDLATSNGKTTTEAFTYLSAMLAADPEIFGHIDAWNSHSYPNPAFSAAPQKYGQNSLRGYQTELAFLGGYVDQGFDVYITETGWEDNTATSRWLSAYYEYAIQHIWSDERIKAVTPFILKGDPGPFSRFSFLSGDDQPTHQYRSLQTALKRLNADHNFVALTTPLDQAN